MATYDSMLEEFRSLIYKDGWGVKRGEFPAPKDAKYIRDLARVGAFLNPENELFCEALELLDTAMIDLFNLRTGTSFRKNKIKLNSFSTFEHGRKLEVACKETGLDATKHLLATVLAEMEIKEGFQGISEAGKCVSFYNNLGDDEFGGAIKSMHLAKDYVGSDHGAFTHRIQWYCASVVKRKLQLENAKTSSTFKSSGLVWGSGL